MNDLSKIMAQLEEQRDAIDRALKALREIGGSSTAVAKKVAAPKVEDEAPSKPGRKKKRRLSAEGRQRIIEAAKRRWAKVQAAKKGK